MTRPESYTLAEIVERLGGRLVGDSQVRISQVSTLSSAGAGHIAFLSQGRYRSQLSNTGASAVILSEADHHATTLPRIVASDPYLYFARVSAMLNPMEQAAPGIHATAVIEPSAEVAPSAHIGPYCHVGAHARIGPRCCLDAGCVIGDGAEIGEDCRLYASVTVYAGCILGKRAIVHSGAVLGADGFGMAPDQGRWVKIPQIGRLRIGDDVEVGANTTIDRGALDDTVIEDGVKLDNQIQIGHNVFVGAHTAMAGCVGIAGSARIGRHCTLGGGAVILGHLELADHVHISAGTLVMKSIDKAGTYSGVFPLQENHAWTRTAVLLRNIDSLEERLRTLERTVSRLQEKE